MEARRDGRREGLRETRALPVFLCALVAFPNNPFVAAAAAQVLGSLEGAARSGSEATGAGAGNRFSAPQPLTFSAPALTAGAAFSPALSPAGFAAPSIALSAAPTALPSAVPHAAASLPISAVPAVAPAASPAAAPALTPALAAAVDGAAPESPKSGRESAAGRDESAGAELNGLFDGEKALDPESVKIVLVAGDGTRVEGTLGSLDAALKQDPGLTLKLNAKGGVRLVVGQGAAVQGLRAEDAPRLVQYLRSRGVDAPVTTEKLTLAAPKAAAGAEGAEAPAAKKTWRNLPARAVAELRFLGRTFADSASKPLPSEILGGIATKAFPLVTSLGVYWATVGLKHPVAMVGLMALSLFQETFHGIFLNTWNNFQDNLSRLRGFSYQMYFNLIYMQGFGAMYRALSWSANPHKTIPPWSPFYWQDVLVMSLVGTFFGTLGYNGLNTLYAKGRLKRWQRSGIQQLRDVLFLLAGPFFATGSMHAFWALFVFQQSLDLAIAVIAWKLKARPTLFVASAPLAGSPEFAAKYPSAVGAAEVPPVKQAWGAVTGNPLARLIAWPFKFAARKLRRKTEAPK